MVLEIEKLEFNYGNQKVLENLCLDIPKETIFGIVGASGSGKTTLIRLIAGIIAPSAGSITLFGETPSSRLWGNIGYMPQLQALYTDLTVQQNVNFFARMFGLSETSHRREVVESIINQVSLWGERNDPVAKLSGGERQRVSLAIALVHNPPLLLLDEPTSGLDPKLRSEIWQYFHNLSANGSTLIISSHVMEDARRCDQVGFLQSGNFIAIGAPDDLTSATGNENANLEDAFLYFMNKDNS
jgi:ABC-2 type transport system ATP-binding protein